MESAKVTGTDCQPYPTRGMVVVTFNMLGRADVHLLLSSTYPIVVIIM